MSSSLRRLDVTSPVWGINAEMPLSPPDDVLPFVIEKSKERVMVFDVGRSVVFQNDKARKFLDRYALPEEISLLVEKLFTAIALGKAAEQFSGLICLHKEIGGRTWLFRVAFREGDQPLVILYFCDQTVSGRFDMNAIRRRHRLTRRESDVLRHLLDGLKNQEIAEELTITEQTVKDYLSSIYHKFGVPDRFTLLRCLVCTSQE